MSDEFTQQAKQGQNWVQSLALQKAEPFLVAVLLCVLLSLVFAFFGPSGTEQSTRIQLDSRINPNTAPTASLIRLPGIGIVRAEAIDAYRRQFAEKDQGQPAFENTSDLQKIKGIGPKTAKNISKWLKFE